LAFTVGKGKEFIFYIDGDPTYQIKTRSDPSSVATVPVTIGSKPHSDWHWDGLIDDVVAFNRILTDYEIRNYMYTIADAKVHSGLIGQWTFNEGWGNTTLDSSGYGNHGWLSGGFNYQLSPHKPVHFKKFSTWTKILESSNTTTN
jgi:hypothetical protein